MVLPPLAALRGHRVAYHSAPALGARREPTRKLPKAPARLRRGEPKLHVPACPLGNPPRDARGGDGEGYPLLAGLLGVRTSRYVPSGRLSRPSVRQSCRDAHATP
jgi:hypothetical protein